MIPHHPVSRSYVYLGLRSLVGNTIRIDDIAVRAAMPSDRDELWAEVMVELGLERLVPLDWGRRRQAVSRLGAGFKYACYAFSRLVREIERRSFILFDEPEIHTHPRLLSAMMRALYRVLDATDSFALVATHSPIVLQEVPARQIYQIRSVEGSFPHVSRPADETFGAPLGELLRTAFGVDHDQRNFDLTLRRLVEQNGTERVREELGDQLALPAWALLDQIDGQGGEP
ncbi:MAG: ATP-binding protein [Deltaproteobacteria bacterium]|nr:ATP-binding protein [Deltaproteobacteria bacterium]